MSRLNEVDAVEKPLTLPKTQFKIRWLDVMGMLLVCGVIIWFVWIALEAIAGTDQVQSLPPCQSEDSDNCYWDAQTMGNGQGLSFEVRDGVVTYK